MAATFARSQVESRWDSKIRRAEAGMRGRVDLESDQPGRIGNGLGLEEFPHFGQLAARGHALRRAVQLADGTVEISEANKSQVLAGRPFDIHWRLRLSRRISRR